MNLCSPDDLLQAVNSNLARWTEAGRKLTIYVAKDPWHPYELIAAGPQGLCVILCWAGAEALGDGEAADLTLATQKLEVYLSFNLGLTAQPSAALTAGTAERPSLLALVSLLTRRLRSLDFKDEARVQRFMRWAGTEPVTTPDGIPLAAYKIKFELDTDVEELETQEI